MAEAGYHAMIVLVLNEGFAGAPQDQINPANEY